MRIFRRVAGGVAAVALTVVLTACSNDAEPAAQTDEQTATTAPESDTAAEDASHNDVDAKFTQMMILHHQGAIEMADLAVERASDPEVQALAERIAAAQGPEIELMSGWLESWDEEMPEDAAMGGMDHGDMEMGGMDQEAVMAELETLSGADFDRRFLELMVEHHRGAIAMAEEQQSGGLNPEAVDLAAKIISDQTKEIAEMGHLLESAL